MDFTGLHPDDVAMLQTPQENTMKYLAVSGFRSEKELDAYLYSYATVQDSGTTVEGRNWAIVVIRTQGHAQYQADRLASGMIGATVHDSEYTAAIRLLERA